MNNVLKKFRKRNVQINISYFLLVILFVALSVSLIAGLIVNARSLKLSISTYYSKTNLADIWVDVDKITANDESFFNDNFDYLKRIYVNQEITLDDNETVQSEIYVSSGKMCTPYIESGKKNDGCYIDVYDAEKYDVGVNVSKIKFEYNYNGNLVELNFEISGTCNLSENMVNSKTGNCRFFIDEDLFFEKLQSKIPALSSKTKSDLNYNQIILKTNNIDDAKQKIEDYYNLAESNVLNMRDRTAIESLKVVSSGLEIVSKTVFAFPLFFVVISILVVVSVIGQLIEKEHYNIGLLKSLGVDNKTITFNYCGYGVLFCLVGSIIGLIFSPLIFPNATFFAYTENLSIPDEYISIKLNFSLILSVLLISVLIGFLASFVSCIRLIKKSPKGCMDLRPTVKLKNRKKSVNISKIIKSSFRNIKHNPIRTIMSIVGVVCCLFLFTFATYIKKYFDASTIASSTMIILSNLFQVYSVILLVFLFIVLIIQIFKEKTYEMALLRLHGVGLFKIWLTVFIEMFVIEFVGLCITFAIAQPISRVLMKFLGFGFNFNIDAIYYLGTYLLGLFSVGVVAALGFIRIYKLNMKDVLRFNE